MEDKALKAILINPFTHEIERYSLTGGWRGINKAINAEICTAVTFNEHGDGVFVDDIGLMREQQAWFLIEGYPQPLANLGLVLGCDEEGESTDPTVSLDWVRKNVMFTDNPNEAILWSRGIFA